MAERFGRDEVPEQEVKSIGEALAVLRDSKDPILRRDAYRYLGQPRHYGHSLPYADSLPLPRMPGAVRGTDEIVAVLSEALAEETDTSTRLTIIQSLRQLRNPAAMPGLLKASNDPERAIRLSVCKTLGSFPGPAAAEQLGELLIRDNDLDVRLAAAEALGKMPLEQAAAALAKGTQDPDIAVQYRSRESLRAILKSGQGRDQDWGSEIQQAAFGEETDHQRRFWIF